MTARRLAAPAVAERDWDSLQFKAIFALSFLIYLAIAIVSRFAPSHWRGDGSRRSIFADARAGAGTTAQMAFAG